jgi:PAS domain-containing protein
VVGVDFLATFGVPVYPFGYLAVLGFLAVILVMQRRHRIVYLTPAVAADQILATMQGAVLVTSPEGAVEMSNRAAAELLGCSETELLDASLDDIFTSETSRTGRTTPTSCSPTSFYPEAPTAGRWPKHSSNASPGFA